MMSCSPTSRSLTASAATLREDLASTISSGTRAEPSSISRFA